MSIENALKNFQPEAYSIIIINFIFWIFIIIARIMIKKANPEKPSKGLLFYIEWFIEFSIKFTVSAVGKKFSFLTPYFAYVMVFLFVCLLFSFTGLPDPSTNFSTPFTLALSSFLIIQISGIIVKGKRYFKKFTEPFILFAPLNIITFPAPLISLSVRLFANAMVGILILEMIYSGTSSINKFIFPFLPEEINLLGIVVVPVLSLYFSVFIAFIQTFVFLMISMILIKIETAKDDEEEDEEEYLQLIDYKLEKLSKEEN